MNILVVGGGGREHAIVWALSKSPRVNKIYCAPGNGGISDIAECVPIKAVDIPAMVDFVKNSSVDFVVVAPDDPLALGMVDAMEAAGIRTFGPRANAAIIESSKVFSKGLMEKYGIPTAKYRIFSDMDEALAYVREQGAPIVIKADGLALGKGVVVADAVETAEAAVISMMREKKFGDSGSSIVVEEFMTGPEVTVLAFTDGKTIIPMISSQDHKRAFDGDKGPNTGGMGAFCPSPLYTEGTAKICMDTIFRPTIEAMNKEGREFRGVIYFGLMLTPNGPRVVEYNARFGDPETQPILSLLDTDILDIFEAVSDGSLDEIDVKWKPGASCCVVMASGGYPDKYDTGFEISGLSAPSQELTVFHAGTKKENGKYLTTGGRVLGVTATAPTLQEAVLRAYSGVAGISFNKARYRKDIGTER